ncbi:hypothetical protein D3C74_202610 [compost metagenome]
MDINLNKNVIIYEENEEIIFINMNNNIFFTLDQIGTLIWKELKLCGDLLKVTNYISEKFKEDPETIKIDIIDLIEQLRIAGVIDCK